MPTYRIEEASSGRAGCKGPKPCGKEHKIRKSKGSLRFGTLVEIQGRPSWSWRHFGCLTEKVIANVKEAIDNDIDNLDGYDEVSQENQEKIKKTLDQGHVDDADIPDSARKPAEEEQEVEEDSEGNPKPKKKSPAKKRAPKKAKKEESDGEGPEKEEEEDAKPKRKRAPPKKKAKKEEIDDDDEEEEEQVKPKPKRARKTAKKDVSESE